MIANFTGDDCYPIRKWLFDFELVMEAMDASPTDLLRLGCQLLGGSAELFIKGQVFVTWHEFYEAMIVEFHRHVAPSDIYRQLAHRVRGPNKSVHRYTLEIQNIASQGTVDQDELMRFIISGLNDSTKAYAILATARDLVEF